MAQDGGKELCQAKVLLSRRDDAIAQDKVAVDENVSSRGYRRMPIGRLQANSRLKLPFYVRIRNPVHNKTLKHVIPESF